MYETWVKSMVDILDELAPVTVVRTRFELPLGSVTGDHSTHVHARLDLIDDDSPWCDLAIEEAGDQVSIGYMIHIPNLNKRTDKEIVANIKTIGEVSDVFLLTPVGEIGQETYVIKGTITAPLEHPTDNFNSATHDMAEKLVRLMQVGGYDVTQGQDGVRDDDLVTWPVE